MNKKTIYLVVAILVVLVAFFVLKRNNTKTLTGSDRDFEFKSTDRIDKIFIAHKKTGKFVILKKVDSLNWILNDTFKVNIHQINTLFEGFRKMQIKRPVSKTEMENVKRVLATEGTKVEIYEKGELSKVYYVGGNTTDEMGTFFLMENAEEPYVCHIPGFNGYLGGRYHYLAEAWRSKNIFSVKDNEIKSIQVEWTGQAQNSFVINNEGSEPTITSNNVTLENNKVANLNNIRTYLKLWENLSFEGFPIDLNAQKIDSISKTTPFLILTVTDKKGNVTSLRIHRKGLKKDSSIQFDKEGNPLQFDIETFYAFINNNSKEVVQIQDFIFGKVMKTTSDFLIN